MRGRDSTNPYDFALVTMLGLLGLRIFEATGACTEDLSDSHGHRVLRVHGKGDKVVLTPLPPAVARAIDRAATDRSSGTHPAEPHRRPYGQARRDPPPSGARPTGRHPAPTCAPTHAAPHLRHHHARRSSATTRRPDRCTPCRPTNHPFAGGPTPRDPARAVRGSNWPTRWPNASNGSNAPSTTPGLCWVALVRIWDYMNRDPVV